MSKLNFIEKGQKNNYLNQLLLPTSMSKKHMRQITGGCNPWSTCDAWNCAPDCICKSNVAVNPIDMVAH